MNNMTKRIKIAFSCIYFFQTIICTTLKAQEQEEWVAYSQRVLISKYQGCKFRFEALVKTEIDDDSAAARLWVRIDNGQRMGFFDNMENYPIRNNIWRKYSIVGKIDSSMTQLAFGAFCSYNGKFYYDDFKIEVEVEKNKWKTIFLADFENNKSCFVQGIQLHKLGLNNNFKAIVNISKRNKFFVIEGKGIENYGSNKKVGKYANVNDIKLYYEIYGEGHPLVVLHGNGGSIKNASPFYSNLSKKYKVIAIDSRGQGKSSNTNKELTYEQMAADVNTLLEQLQIDSAFIWGHSDGAIIGLILAKDYPKKVEKLLAFGANIQPDSLALFSWAIDYIKKMATNSKEKDLNILMLKHPNIAFEELSKIKAPVLIMAGDRDMIKPEHTVKLFQNILKVQLCIIPGSTHFASWEKKDFFLKILNDFFNYPFVAPSTEELLKN